MPAEDKMPSTDPPRLLAFYQDLWDDDGTAVGWRPVAWGLRLADGSAVSVPAGGPTAVTMWCSVDDACAVLDAHVDFIEPRRSLGKDLCAPDLGRADEVTPAEASSGGEVR